MNSKLSIKEMLEVIREEADTRDMDDTEWIVDTYNHLFGTDYNLEDY